MPRKLRHPKQQRPSAVDVDDAVFHYLTWNDFSGACEIADAQGIDPWTLFFSDVNELRAAWQAIEADALREWTTRFPGTRPRAWWEHAAPELRRVYGRFTVKKGIRRCQDTGIPYGAPDDLDDRPMVESTPAYLDRLSLWLDGERARVPPEDFGPAPFSWGLMQAPRLNREGR